MFWFLNPSIMFFYFIKTMGVVILLGKIFPTSNKRSKNLKKVFRASIKYPKRVFLIRV